MRSPGAPATAPECSSFPTHSGLLTGTFSRERVESLPQDDWRRSSPDFTANLDRNLALADALRPIASRHGVTQAAVAVAWTLAWLGVTGAIVGARNPGQVDGWLPAASLRLTQDDLDDIATAIERTGAGAGPIRPLSVLWLSGRQNGNCRRAVRAGPASQWLPRSIVRILTTPCGSPRGPSVVDGLN